MTTDADKPQPTMSSDDCSTMPRNPIQMAAERRTIERYRTFGEEVRRLREDAGVSQRALARVCGVDQAELSRIEAGNARPSIATCAAIGLGLGADLSIRLYPNAGPAIRDRHQVPILEALIKGSLGPWRAWPEVGVRHPVRGWIDVVLAERRGPNLVATEIVSAMNRIEQLLRWSGAKADALPSAENWPLDAVGDPRISRLLIIRSTAANRTLVTTYRRTFAAAHPGDPWQAVAAIRGEAPWPGSAQLWAVDRPGGQVELRASVGSTKG